MFTNCPNCARQFRIRASQLARAEGLVQCGFCGHQFNALERLYDKPLVIDRELMTETPAEDPVEPEFYIPEIQEETESEEKVPASTAEQVLDMTIDLPDPEPDPEPEPEAVRSVTNDVPAIEESPVVKEFPFPNELVEEETPKASIVSRLFWSFGVLLLLLAATAQTAWFNRDILLSHYPQFTPQAKQLCQYFNCRLIRNRNISAIKLLNRDVRIHPRYEDALLVNATMTNLSSYSQRFPLVLLSLFDTNGIVIAYRRVSPADYLDSSIDVEAGMAPDTPIHFVLEVADRGSGAVSFEFDFL
jgi:predicted Zn finger-like uncharacterized protein